MSKKTLIIIAIIATITIFFVIISNQKTESNNPSSTNQSSTLANNFETISTVKDLKARLELQNPTDVLIDVRTPEEFAAGHISGAINLDLQNPNFSSEIKKLDSSKTYLVFCRSGNRALTASQEMSKIGLKTIYSMEGFTSWVAAGYSIIN